ncbi:hypothetical protein CPC08DRAFT_158753 [Agrocybe pediades]|nr:hypothetical protein CPC08DRAFT_158753 [Agrocybe pediades]
MNIKSFYRHQSPGCFEATAPTGQRTWKEIPPTSTPKIPPHESGKQARDMASVRTQCRQPTKRAHSITFAPWNAAPKSDSPKTDIPKLKPLRHRIAIHEQKNGATALFKSPTSSCPSLLHLDNRKSFHVSALPLLYVFLFFI